MDTLELFVFTHVLVEARYQKIEHQQSSLPMWEGRPSTVVMHGAYLIRGIQSSNQKVTIVMSSCKKQGGYVSAETEVTKGKGALMYP